MIQCCDPVNAGGCRSFHVSRSDRSVCRQEYMQSCSIDIDAIDVSLSPCLSSLVQISFILHLREITREREAHGDRNTRGVTCHLGARFDERRETGRGPVEDEVWAGAGVSERTIVLRHPVLVVILCPDSASTTWPP